jgi:hypothetical protein
MSKLTLAIFAALTGLLAACGGPQAEPANRTETASGASYQERIQAMPEAERNAVFIRAIQDAQQTCQHVESSTASGAYRGRPVWTARCTGGGTFTIVLGPGDMAEVVNANEATLVDGNQSAAQNAQ